MKKKVFFIMSTDDYSGAEAVNFNIIKMLSDKYDFFWISRKGKINKYLEENNIKWIEIHKLSVSEIKRVIREYKPDILHATDFRASTVTALANKNIPLIEHLHNNAPWIKKICLNSLLFYIAGKKADFILTVSESIKEEYIFAKKIEKKIRCIGNPTSTVNITNKVTGIDFEKKYDVCCVARLASAKNPYLFIDIISDLKKNNESIRVIWVGDGELKADAMAYCKKNNLENNIDFVGKKNNPYKYMASSKVFLLTSSWEGYGLAAFEALALGLPCVVSNVGGLPGIVNAKCGFICNAKKDYEDAVSLLLNNNDVYNKLSNGALKRANELDNISEYMNLVDDIYKEVVKGEN